MAYYDKERAAMLENQKLDAMRYGGFCPKKMPLESNNPRNIQGRKLRRGGCVKMMKGGSIK